MTLNKLCVENDGIRKTNNEELLSNSAVTTPGSVVDEEKCLVPYSIGPKRSPKLKWYSREYIPFAILIASVLEILFYICCTETLFKLLRFEPNNLLEFWRFFTYMLLHVDSLHLVLNVIMQLLFAYFLEKKHGNLRVLSLYLLGGVTGVLGASCFHPDSVIGASAGVYALLISHVADILMNFENMKYNIYRCICILVIVMSDVAFNCVHVFSKDEPLISWEAHVVGGISGLFLGLVLFKRDEYLAKFRKLVLFWIGIVAYLSLMISLVILTIQIRKCTPSNIIYNRYIYFC